jgi:hypothetical protein
VVYNIPAGLASSKVSGSDPVRGIVTYKCRPNGWADWATAPWQSDRATIPGFNAGAAFQPLAIARARSGLSTKSARPTTTKFMTAVTANTMCQEPVDALIILATGTRKAEVPFAV